MHFLEGKYVRFYEIIGSTISQYSYVRNTNRNRQNILKIHSTRKLRVYKNTKLYTRCGKLTAPRIRRRGSIFDTRKSRDAKGKTRLFLVVISLYDVTLYFGFEKEGTARLHN